MADGGLRRWGDLTSPEVARLVARDPVVVLPLGSMEQHGPHLPLSTDTDIGMGLLSEAMRSLDADFPVSVLPPWWIGASLEHSRFPGTLTLDPGLLVEAICQIGDGLARAGVRRLVVADSHGGNRGSVDAAGLRLRDEHAMLVVKAHWARFARPSDVRLPDAEWRHGWHGGAVETAMMLHLRPEAVRTGQSPSGPSLGQELGSSLRRVGPEGEAPFSWLAGDLHPSGTTGNAGLADAALGRRLVEHYGAALAETLREARAFPLERLV